MVCTSATTRLPPRWPTSSTTASPDPQAFRRMARGFPPVALAVLEVPVPWADLDPATAHLAAFHVGKG